MSHFVSGHTGLAYGWSLTLVTLGLLALVGGGLWFTGAALGQQVDELLDGARALQQGQQRLEQHAWARRLLAELPQAGAKIAEKTDVAAKAPGVVSNVFGALASFVVFVALGLYLAIDPGVYVRGLVRLVPQPRRARVQEVLRKSARPRALAGGPHRVHGHRRRHHHGGWRLWACPSLPP